MTFSSAAHCPPVLLIIFNRPDLTQRVFERIRQAGPRQLFVAADGPRSGVPADEERCARARQIVEQVDWECEVHTLFRETNLGCKRAVSSAIDWFFENVEAGIILEDDCVSHPTFFPFCAELLERYHDDERIMAISGDNFQRGRQRTPYGYYFSRYNHCWGWATWTRAWQYYDRDMKLWPEIRDVGWLEDVLSGSLSVRYWARIFQSVYEGHIDTWAYQWTFACWVQSGLSILPNANLVSNIGFHGDATHTKGSSRFANMPTEAIEFPLQHPEFVIRDAQADEFTERNHFGISERNNLLGEIRQRLSVIKKRIRDYRMKVLGNAI